MAHKVQAYATYGPRIKSTTPMTPDEFTEQLVEGTNQSQGSMIAMLAEMEAISVIALKSGRIVKLPNGMTLRPVIKQDGQIEIAVRVSRRLVRKVNAGFRGEIENAENIGKSQAELIRLWNENHPDDPINI